ncbi:MAG TPA: hypothetical protein VM822_11720, partial [Pseudolabrys sp.]|nr:hypothetical protein [Pseudolabrys sp.]
ALAAFVKRPQASLLKSALCLFYKRPIKCGQRNVTNDSIEIIENYASGAPYGFKPFSVVKPVGVQTFSRGW